MLFFVILAAADLLVNRSRYRSPGWMSIWRMDKRSRKEKIGSITRGRRRKKDERATPRRLAATTALRTTRKTGPRPDSSDQIFRNLNCSVVAYNGCFPMPFHSYEPKPIRFRRRTQTFTFIFRPRKDLSLPVYCNIKAFQPSRDVRLDAVDKWIGSW